MENKYKKKANEENNEEKIDFEEYINNQEHTTFVEMNISRPLLKVCII